MPETRERGVLPIRDPSEGKLPFTSLQFFLVLMEPQRLIGMMPGSAYAESTGLIEQGSAAGSIFL